MVYVAADLHIDAVLRRSEACLHNDGYLALTSLVAEVVRDIAEHGYKQNSLIIAGDITELPKISGSTIHSLKVNIEFLQQHGVKVYFIRGNHDIDRGIGIAKALGAVHLSEKQDIKSDDGIWKVAAFDYAPTEEIRSKVQKCAADGEAIDLLVLHSPFQHMLGFDGAWQLELSDIPDQVHITLSGDIHKQEIRSFLPSDTLNCDNEFERWFVSPGVTHACDVSETGPYGVVRLSKMEAPVFIPIYTRKIISFTLDPADTFEKAREELQQVCDLKETLPPIVELTFLPDQWQLVQNLRSVFGCQLVLLEKQRDLTASLAAPSDLKVDMEHPEEGLAFVIDPDKDRVLYDFLSELLSNSNSTAVSGKLAQIGIA